MSFHSSPLPPRTISSGFYPYGSPNSLIYVLRHKSHGAGGVTYYGNGQAMVLWVFLAWVVGLSIPGYTCLLYKLVNICEGLCPGHSFSFNPANPARRLFSAHGFSVLLTSRGTYCTLAKVTEYRDATVHLAHFLFNTSCSQMAIKTEPKDYLKIK